MEPVDSSTSSTNSNELDILYMTQALELAARGQGAVEPNPMVGCVLVRDGEVVGQGYHRVFGQAHAEVNAIATAGSRAKDATVYVTLEPCSHHGKTPPCTDALIVAGVSRVVIAMQDPWEQVAGRGIEKLRQAGIQVDCFVCEDEAKRLNAPYLKRIQQQRPWVIAKWAMTLDGKIATGSGSSKWISSESSRQFVHQLRGRMDAILVGSRTATLDDPQLTARPAGLRAAKRIIVDGEASISLDSKLVQTAHEIPVWIAVNEQASEEKCRQLRDRGCEVLVCHGDNHLSRMDHLLEILAKRGVTNLFVEGGSSVLGNLFDLAQIDEVHVFLAPKLIGGTQGLSPLSGAGFSEMTQAKQLKRSTIKQVEDDIYLHGFLSE